MVEQLKLETRAALHAALAEPTRLHIVDLLQLGDASPAAMQHDWASVPTCSPTTLRSWPRSG